jgi:sugar phosphate permease
VLLASATGSFPQYEHFGQTMVSAAGEGNGQFSLRGGRLYWYGDRLSAFSAINNIWGWEYSFIIPGLLALLATLPLWLRWISDSPGDNPYISVTELNYICSWNREADGEQNEKEGSGVRLLLGNPSFWMLCLAYTAFLSSWWGLLTWMPLYLVEAGGLICRAPPATLHWLISFPPLGF